MKNRKCLFLGFGLLGAFVLWTVALGYVDVQAIGPGGSSVGFATMNRYMHHLTGTHFLLYTITDWLGLVPVGICLCFAILGLVQWIRRRQLFRVDPSILILGIFYLVVMAAYILFEMYPVNYRPVLISGYLEASYPSSTTMLVLCVMPTALIQLRRCIKRPGLRKWIAGLIIAFMAFMVLGRFLSGVHWFSDMLGGGFLSAGLVLLYRFGIGLAE